MNTMCSIIFETVWCQKGINIREALIGAVSPYARR